MLQFTLGFSSCPNDTYIFDALVNHRLPSPYAFLPKIHDVEVLNKMAAKAELDVSKASVHAFFHLTQEYQLLDSGAALGRGCGPLWIGKNTTAPKGGKVALPGAWTTANLLFQLSQAGDFEPVQMTFDRIIPAILNGEVDSGVIIHESRFTYQTQGLNCYQDLGDWWEKSSGLPIPLGGILVRRSLPKVDQKQIEALIAQSILFADRHPEAGREFIKAHSQELADEVIDQHIGLYVNQSSKSLGEEGRRAVTGLYQRALEKGLVEKVEEKELFC
ncbi:MAG: hypothetical protein A2600_04535 [Candidatus Lambdaproteobacteria bacterium RIFOXYD1_FULL_56_27]|uniref:1,4-dihydroxy-6-naphtoate synthase n=1 Tax=Candidatus Lambdaproteobacteria bacterium RIFOXYD2_FULL_56_26 TaxID=1817773 RepID=A0A1F6H3S7_9PROT|nr:MAG: hypothetical protein A2426_13600 [Candidatus Lambdaproteobacteria bacterium RIFOXYC1_FULL_56_13]OGH05021.1 MAG: hypothetical protein A2557_08600 [Candidatus Lambdaproteobacteria bacterium RIFOXYD2_FULL_56_26]OGH09486.1 MAG: hypothetical protein A2600_04535 [Candidatus Lambdaproteobacteria bacterium RIFOXYD1_FULL_56_27]